MSPLINTPADVARLRAIAKSWQGTPWTADGAIRGTGVSCSMLPYAILAEFGHVAPTPPARKDLLKVEIMPSMIAHLDGLPSLYVPVDVSTLLPGDVVLFDMGIGHLALVTGKTEIIHSFQTTGAHFSQFTEKKLLSRLVKAWRPIHG